MFITLIPESLRGTCNTSFKVYRFWFHSTTVLSPYLKFGCLSVRTMYWRLQEILKKGKHSQPPVSLVGQLMWREFFYTCGATIENFDKMKGYTWTLFDHLLSLFQFYQINIGLSPPKKLIMYKICLSKWYI